MSTTARQINCQDCSAPVVARGGRQKRCPGCQANLVRTRGQLPESLKKREAQNAVRTAIRNGTLVRRPCESFSSWRNRDCGRTPAHAHHEDYSKPLEIVWLCASCHKSRHWDLKRNPVPPLDIRRNGAPQPDRDW